MSCCNLVRRTHRRWAVNQNEYTPQAAPISVSCFSSQPRWPWSKFPFTTAVACNTFNRGQVVPPDPSSFGWILRTPRPCHTEAPSQPHCRAGRLSYRHVVPTSERCFTYTSVGQCRTFSETSMSGYFARPRQSRYKGLVYLDFREHPRSHD